MVENGLEVGHARSDGSIAVEAARFAAAAEVEAGERQPRLREVAAEQQVLVAVLAGAHAVAGDDAGSRS